MKSSFFAAAVLILSVLSFVPSVALAHSDRSKECHCQAGLPCKCGPDCDCPNCDCDLPADDPCAVEGYRDKRDCMVSRVRHVVKRTTRSVHRVRAIRRKASRAAADPSVPMKWAGGFPLPRR
jgi:hypothetical protein